MKAKKVEYYVETAPHHKTGEQQLLSTHETVESARAAILNTPNVIRYSPGAIDKYVALRKAQGLL